MSSILSGAVCTETVFRSFFLNFKNAIKKNASEQSCIKKKLVTQIHWKQLKTMLHQCQCLVQTGRGSPATIHWRFCSAAVHSHVDSSLYIAMLRRSSGLSNHGLFSLALYLLLPPAPYSRLGISDTPALLCASSPSQSGFTFVECNILFRKTVAPQDAGMKIKHFRIKYRFKQNEFPQTCRIM